MRLHEGRLVAFPTETVYGLGADATNDHAVAEIYAAKGRPSFNPLITHVLGAQAAFAYGKFNPLAERLMAAFWPGPLTLILPRVQHCALSLLVSAGGDSVGLRCPAHPVARALLEACGLPLAAPSANRSGRVSPTLALHVREEFSADLMVLDGGACEVGIESTVLDLTGEPMILRPGSITREMIEEIIGRCHSHEGGNPLAYKSPGMLASHYAPNARVRLNAKSAEAGEAMLAFGGVQGDMNLSPSGDLTEAAANLFSMLRALDARGVAGIAISPIPMEGLGLAINDRLARAAVSYVELSGGGASLATRTGGGLAQAPCSPANTLAMLAMTMSQMARSAFGSKAERSSPR